jgi:hypothetical protein
MERFISDASMIEKANEIRKVLETRRAMVSFRKMDGTLRDMVCLSYAEISEEFPQYKLSSGKLRPRPPTLITVYEENNGFRSFYVQDVISFTPFGNDLRAHPARDSRPGFYEWLAQHNPEAPRKSHLLRML